MPACGQSLETEMEIDFDISPYTGVREALLKMGIRCSVNSRHQIAVSVQDGAIWPDHGNSFWITCATGSWHLFTWSPIGYEVSDREDLLELCRRCIEISGSAMHTVPAEIVTEFGLVRLEDHAADYVYAAMQTAP